MKSSKKFDFVVIGATGEQGSIASRDLLENGYRVLLCGRHPDKLRKLLKNKRAAFEHVDLSDVPATTRVIKNSGAKIVVNCAELAWNMQAMEAAWKANAHYLDLGGLQEMTAQQYKRDRDWRTKNLIALLGCGSTPGIANVMTAYAVEQLDTVDHIDLGFAWDSNIKQFVLPYSFESIVYELTVPAIVLENGRFKKIQACALEGITEFLGVGHQMTYCIVHSEVYTYHKYFKEKGLRSVHYKAGFPLHSFKVLDTLMALGFASKKPLGNDATAASAPVLPLDFTSRILHHLQRPKHYAETEDLWVKVYGTHKGKPKNIEMDCLVKPTRGWSEAGSNVDTGRTIAVMAMMLHRGEIVGVGVTAPEIAVPPKLFFEEIEKRGMRVYKNRRKVS
jgi:saccharopine dehydrogenase-like NADP-dependent oxidoreductase